MEVTGFGGRGEYTAGHIQLWLKVGPIASQACFHVVRTEVSYHVLLGRPWLHKHRLVPSTYHQCVKGRLNGKMIRIADLRELPMCKDVQDDPEPDLRGLLARKKKRKEAPAAELDEVPRCVKIRGLDGKIIYKL